MLEFARIFDVSILDKKEGNYKMKHTTVMVVDDDPTIREILEVNLRSRGFDVYAASNGHDALNHFQKIHPVLVILDVIMPDLDGWEVCKVIKDQDPENSVKILMLTAKSTDRDKLIGKSILKADEYLTKPFELSELLAAIKKLIGEN
jgi:DNA-binding response OmpR family regulator